MCYSEYISAGGTNETLVAALDEFFRGGESTVRRVICQDNDERNQILRALAEYSSLMLGFSISFYTAILGDMAIDVVELPDIMTLFGSVY